MKSFWVFKITKLKKNLFFVENKNQIFIYNLNILELKNFLVFRVKKTNFPFVISFLTNKLFGIIYPKRAVNLFNIFRKKITFSLHPNTSVRIWGNFDNNKKWIFFFRKKIIFRLVNPNCFITFFFKSKLLFDPFTFTKHWNFQITLPMLEIKKMIIDTGNSRKYIQKTVKLIPQKTLLRLKISKILILVDISSRRILSKMFFSQTKEIITVSNYRPFIQIFQSEKHEPKNKTSFFVLSELTIFFTLLSSEKKLYWRMLMKLDNRFFGIPRKKGDISPPRNNPFWFWKLKTE